MRMFKYNVALVFADLAWLGSRRARNWGRGRSTSAYAGAEDKIQQEILEAELMLADGQLAEICYEVLRPSQRCSKAAI